MGLFNRTKRSSTTSSAASSALNSGATTPTAVDNSTQLSTSPTSTNLPLALTKTSSRLTLTKTLTWGKKTKEEKQRRRIESWEKEDQNEWDAPTGRNRHGRKLCSKKEQEVLRAFEWKLCRESMDGGKSRSCFSGVSPGCSRMGSVDDGYVGLASRHQGSALVRETSRSDTSSEGSVVRSASEE